MPQPSIAAEPPDMPANERKRLQALALVVQRRTEFLSGQTAALRAGLQLGKPINPAEAMRRAEEMMSDHAHVGHGMRDLLRASRSIYRDAEARRAVPGVPDAAP